MRLSVEHDDRGNRHREIWWPGKVDVTLDGVVVQGVITADEDAGEIVHVLFDRDGYLVTRGDEIVQETRRGTVVIHIPPEVRLAIEEADVAALYECSRP